MPLQKQVLTVLPTGLRTDIDPKAAPVGACDLLENTQTVRTTNGGFEVVKRPGTPSITMAVDPFTTANVTAGRKVAALGDEMVMTDGKVLYSWRGSVSASWTARGRCPSLSAVRSQLDGVPAYGVVMYNEKTSQDGAYAGGWAVFLANFTDGGTPGISYYVVDTATGALVTRGSVAAYRGRVLAVGSTFFLFTYDTTNGISCYTMAVAAGTPAFGNRTTVVAAASVNAHFFDVTYDSFDGYFIVGYRNTTPGLTLKIWNTNQTGGTSANYNTRDPDKCIGFLHQDWSAGGNVYLGIGGTAAGVRALTHSATALTNSSDTQATGTGTCRNITGWRESTRSVLIYEIPGATTDLNRVDAFNGVATVTNVKRGVGLVSRVFKVGTTYHFSVALESTTQRHQYLIEMQPGGSLDGAVTIEGLLMANDAGGLNPDAAYLGGPAALAADRVQLGCMGQLGAGTGVSGARHYTVEKFDLRFNEDLLSAPVPMNGVLHIPGACPMIYDGANVCEEGFLAFPEAPGVGGGTGGGAVFTAGTYQYLLVISRLDRSGRITRSAVGPVASTTLSASWAAIHLTALPTLRMVTKDVFRVVPTERLEIYRTPRNSSEFFLVTSFANDSTIDDLGTYDDTTSDLTLVTNEPLYTSTGEVQNAMPPAVLGLCRHRDRLFAASGNGAVYWTKEAAGIGDAAAFSDADGFFMDFDTVDGPPVALASDGVTLFVAKRSRVYPLQGDGPSLDGNNGYTFPSPLPAEVGVVVPRAFSSTPDGLPFQSAKGFHLLDRGGGVQPLPGADAYDGLTVTGGVTLDDRPMALLTTSDGRTLCWDWQNKIWHTWTGQAAVACCRWQNKFVWLGSDGKVHVETPAAWADDAGAYTYKIRTAWIHLAGIFGRAKVYGVRVLADFLANATLSITTAIESYGAQVDETTTIAGTTATKFPIAVRPAQSRAEAIRLTVEETSTGQGVAVTALGIEIGAKAGAGKEPAGQFTA